MNYPGAVMPKHVCIVFHAMLGIRACFPQTQAVCKLGLGRIRVGKAWLQKTSNKVVMSCKKSGHIRNTNSNQRKYLRMLVSECPFSERMVIGFQDDINGFLYYGVRFQVNGE